MGYFPQTWLCIAMNFPSETESVQLTIGAIVDPRWGEVHGSGESVDGVGFGLRAIPFEKVVEGVSDVAEKMLRVVWEWFRYHCGVVCKNAWYHCGVVSQLDHSTIAGWSIFSPAQVLLDYPLHFI